MLSRPTMQANANAPLWDIFCAVVDNFGDIGVCWRLARQLASEHGLRVRLWVDDLKSFQPLLPELDPASEAQTARGVEIRRWPTEFPVVTPGDAVIEAFGCRLPDSFIAAMAQRTRAPLWINLEYLSAEGWVAGCHALPSPHPRLPLTKYFFFPGFTAGTGGLLRECDLPVRRDAFAADRERQAEFWRELGFARPAAGQLSVSLFAYETPAIGHLLKIWSEGGTGICCSVPVSRALPLVETFCERALKPGDVIRRGALEIRVLPFVEQSRYDALLWASDFNFVRGEDSFVRAQWAAKPLVWHIYAQEDDVHLGKLDAFLDLYCNALPSAAAAALRAFWQAWNTGRLEAGQWQQLLAALPALRAHAAAWAEKLAAQEDLSGSLVRFFRSKV